MERKISSSNEWHSLFANRYRSYDFGYAANSIKNHFVGKSIFQKRTEEAILTVQPYSGTYLTAKKESIKYVKHLQTQKEYLFDFKKDPKESSNLIQNKSYAEITKSLKSATQKLIINEQLIRENRIWPSEKERHHQEEQKNFSLIVTQQYKPLRGLDAKRFDALQKAYAIDIVYFLNSHELIHAELGKLNFYHDFRMEIKGDFLVNTEGYYDIYIASDDGFRLYIDNKKISEFTGGRPLQGEAYRIKLSKGRHLFSLQHYQGYGDVGLEMKYKFASSAVYLFWGASSKEIMFGDDTN